MSPDLAKIVRKIRRVWGSADSDGVTAETFRALLENSLDAIVLFDSDWKIIYASTTTQRLLGYTPAEIQAADAFSFVHPDDIVKVRDAFAECLGSPRKPVRTVARIRHKDGSWRVMEGIITNFLDVPDVRCVVNNYRDITENIRAEAALRESEEKFKRAFRSNPDAMSITTLADGKFLDVNDAFLRLTGFSREELVGHASLETSWVEKEHRRRLVRVLSETGRVESMEVCFRKKTGEIFFANLSAEIVEIGGTQCLLATSQDITERRRAADGIRQSEEQYRSLVELAPYGICRATRDGQMLMVNSALVKMLGYESADEMLGLDLGTQIYKDPEERERILQKVQSGSAGPAETTWKRKDGSAISVRLAARLIYDNQSQLLQTEIFVENVTGQKELERQLQIAQKMDAIGQLAGGVAHDFNNLMMIMRSRAELVMMDASKPANVVEQAEEIVRATRQAASLTRQLLAFSRHQVLEPVVLNFNVLLAELSDMLPRLIGRHIDTKIVAAPNLGRVKVDRAQFEQVVMNLALNARDAMPSGGRLVIETGNLTLDNQSPPPSSLMAPGRYVMLSVTDTGTGMDQETQAHIFEPFFTTKERGKGTGLGLAMVYGIVQQSGGHISVLSTPGTGTCFKIYLPEVTEAEASGVAEPLLPSPGGTETILFVEDEEALRRVGADFLRSKGYDVLVAENGIEALKLCRSTRHPIQLLVTDLIMPRMGGAELAKYALALNPRLRTIYISGYSGHTLPGAPKLDKPFLQKPFSMTDLARQVRAALDNKSDQERALAGRK